MSSAFRYNRLAWCLAHGTALHRSRNTRDLDGQPPRARLLTSDDVIGIVFERFLMNVELYFTPTREKSKKFHNRFRISEKRASVSPVSPRPCSA